MNKLEQDTIDKIRTCFVKGLSIRRTAAFSGADRNTVNTYFKDLRSDFQSRSSAALDDETSSAAGAPMSPDKPEPAAPTRLRFLNGVYNVFDVDIVTGACSFLKVCLHEVDTGACVMEAYGGYKNNPEMVRISYLNRTARYGVAASDAAWLQAQKIVESKYMGGAHA